MTAKPRNAPPRSIDRLIRGMSRAVGKDLPSVSAIAREKRDPFRILVSTILSLRTKDEVTAAASKRLFAVASSPGALSRVSARAIERAIYPVGFYKTKARTIRAISERIVREHGGVVPDTLEGLLAFKGVGRKTANLVITLGYGKKGICVDTHVHRVSNRIGLVSTPTPERTEFALMDVLPEKYWIGYNELVVSFGQKVCKPVSPLCSSCFLGEECPKIGVGKRR